jgi:hypothetical protein
MQRTTISLPDGLAVALRREAQRRRTSVSDVTRQALEAHLGLTEDGRRHLSFIGIGASGYTDTSERVDEILAEEWTKFIEEDSGLADRR